MKPWGQHLIIDAKGSAEGIKLVGDGENIRNYVKELVPSIDMISFGEPIIERFALEDERASGYSLVQLIETSNICFHYSDYNGDFYGDIFSCKPYDIKIALEITKKKFAQTKIKYLK